MTNNHTLLYVLLWLFLPDDLLTGGKPYFILLLNLRDIWVLEDEAFPCSYICSNVCIEDMGAYQDHFNSLVSQCAEYF